MRSLALFAGTAAAAAVGRATAPITCADGLYVLIGRGTGEAAGTGVSGLLGDSIAAQIKGSKVMAVEYPATFTDPSYLDSEKEGVKNLQAEIKEYVAKCPKSKLAYLGYSQGAQIASDAFCGPSGTSIFSTLPALPADIVNNNVVAIVLFGDPSHNITAPYNKGTSKKNGIFPRTDPGKCPDYKDKIISYCDTGDVYCDSGDVRAVHGTYLSTYGDDIKKFVVDKYESSVQSTGGGGKPSPSQPSTGGNNSTTTAQPTQSQTGTPTSKPSNSPAPTGAAAGLLASKSLYAALPVAALCAALQLL